MTTPSTATRLCSRTATTVSPPHLAEGLDVRLTHVVERVQWTPDGVAVTTDYGTVTADTAVITVPVGVLQSDDFVIEPPLPDPIAGRPQPARR